MDLTSEQDHDSIRLITCRVCKKTCGEFLTLDSELYTGTRLLEVFNEFTQLQAAINDQLPQLVCQTCVGDLKYVRAFVLKAQKADQQFREIGITRKYHTENFQTTNEIFGANDDDEEDQQSHKQDLDSDDSMQNEVEYLSDVEVAKESESVLFELCYETETSSTAQEDDDTTALKPNPEQRSIENKKETNEAAEEQQDALLEKSKLRNEDIDINSPKTCISKCKYCKAVLANKASFQKHLLLHHADKKLRTNQVFTCEECAKDFSTRQKLKQHNLVHTKAKDFKCPDCPKSFATIFRQRAHMKWHYGERDFVCEYCDMRLLTSASLKTHLLLHSGERPHICEVCGKTFAQRSVLITHQALHVGKTTKCPQCPKMFSRPSQLILHRRVHTGERPYKCPECDCSYKQKSHLDRHLGTHLGVHFKCLLCDKMYTKKSTLTDHVQQVHGKAQIYKCAECNMEYNKKKSLQYHVRSKHRICKDNITLGDTGEL